MSELIEAKLCKQHHCDVAKNGKCLEGLELNKCPHFYIDYVAKDGVEIDGKHLEDAKLLYFEKNGGKSALQSFVEKSVDAVRLFSGDDLSLDELPLVTFKYNTKKVFIIGESDCGKTTLLAVVNDMLQLSKFKELIFAGSATMIGFEKRSHYSRTKSNANKPETEKTKTSEFNFLHLALKSKSHIEKKAAHLLISDISGERFKIASTSSSAMKELSILKLADHLVFVIDGAHLVDPFKRNAALFGTVAFIRKAIDENVFNRKTILRVVISKCDLLDTSDEAITYVQKLIDNQFTHKICQIKYHMIASRPEKQKEKYSLGYGLEFLLNEWIKSNINDLNNISTVNGKRCFNYCSLNNENT